MAAGMINKIGIEVRRVVIEKFDGDITEGKKPVETVIIENGKTVRIMNKDREIDHGSN